MVQLRRIRGGLLGVSVACLVMTGALELSQNFRPAGWCGSVKWRHSGSWRLIDKGIDLVLCRSSQSNRRQEALSILRLPSLITTILSSQLGFLLLEV